MREVGVRELKRALSDHLRHVQRGEAITVTVRGLPVAQIVPVGSPAPSPALRRLAVEGRVTLPSISRPAILPPIVRSETSASAAVLADREAER